jgi:excisionase family DNA binding protein
MKAKPRTPQPDLTVAEVVELTGLKRSTVYWRISKGLLDSVWSGGRVRVPRKAVDALLNEQAA